MAEHALNLSCNVYGGANFKYVIKCIKYLKENVVRQSLISVFFHRHYITVHVFQLANNDLVNLGPSFKKLIERAIL